MTKQPLPPERFFPTHEFFEPRYVAELLALFKPLIAQYSAAGVRSRYLELLEIAYDDLRVRCVKIVTTSDPSFRPNLGFPERGLIVKEGGGTDFKMLANPELRARFLLGLMERFAFRLTPQPGQRPPPRDLSECVNALVVALRRLLEDPESRPALP